MGRDKTGFGGFKKRARCQFQCSYSGIHHPEAALRNVCKISLEFASKLQRSATFLDFQPLFQNWVQRVYFTLMRFFHLIISYLTTAFPTTTTTIKKNKNYIMMLFLIFPSIFEAAYDLIEYLLVLLNQQGF